MYCARAQDEIRKRNNLNNMNRTFYETCPCCGTYVKIEEVGDKYPAKTYDHYYCPVCEKSLGQKNTMYFFEESVESLDNTIEPFKTQYLSKNK